MLQLITKIALMVSGFCIFATFVTFLLFRVRKATKIALVFEIIAFISGAVAFLPHLSFIQIIKALALCAIISAIFLVIWLPATAPLGHWLSEMWDEEDKLNERRK